MPINKNAMIRYKVLDRCFSNPAKKYFIDDLMKECSKKLSEHYLEEISISRRQIMNDIEFMKSADGWNIDLVSNRDGKRVYYRYENTDFSINNMPLNEMEINQLKSTIETLSQFKGMPQFEWINEMLPKLQQRTIQDSKHIMDFENNPFLKGIDKLGEIYNAIVYKKVLIIQYQPYETENPYEVIMHPYFLKQYNNRWYLFGYNPFNDKYDWNLAIDRMIVIKEIKETYKPNKNIDWQEYFDDIIGVTKTTDKEPEKIILHFYNKTAKYIETKPLHGSQKSKWVDKSKLEVSIEVIINYELEKIILSYADSVKVISPKTFRNLILKRLKNAKNIYEI